MTVRVTQRSNRGVVVTTPSDQVQVSKTEQQIVTAVTKGPQGPAGPAGPQGPVGASLVWGSGQPNNTVGSNGDSYLDVVSGQLYGPKQNGVWPSTPSAALTIPTLRSVFSQPSAASTWTITHALGGNPVVTVVDSAGSVVFGDVSYINNSEIVVTFSAPFAGYAYLT